jgi:hypothetical protein
LRDTQGDLRALFADNRETHYVTRFKAVAAKRLQAHSGEAAWARCLTVRVSKDRELTEEFTVLGVDASSTAKAMKIPHP